MAGKVLIVDDEKDMLALLQRILEEETDHVLVTETDPVKAFERFRSDTFDLVITDLKMPRMDGIQLLEAMKKLNPEISVIIMTAYATIETAVEAIQKGAYDYITKPFRRERILMTVDKVMKWQAMVHENKALRKALEEKNRSSSLIGSTPVMRDILERIQQVASTMATVLITGPSGTGKELIARAIHENSSRCSKKLITLNCTAIPEQVIESELFGYMKGAFTGALKDKKGLVQEAHEGTLFLDEIGDMGTAMQTKLLRLLQEGEYKPVGSVTTRKADIRFIAATNHDLKADIREKRFREDLYYRLNVIRFYLPPLSERRDDIPLLSYHFLKKYAARNRKEIRSISHDALKLLLSQDFPGNVRELENVIERGVIFCKTDTLEKEDLFLEDPRADLFPEVDKGVSGLDFREAKEMVIQRFHEQYIQRLLRESDGNISKAAEMAGIQRQYLHRLMKEAGIDAERFKSRS